MKDNSNAVKVTLRDGFLEVEGECPGLREKLRYFRKEIKLVNYQRTVEKHFEDLFSVPEDRPDITVTMPGFAHRVLEHCRKKRIPFQFRDARTPFPQPDYEKAFKGLRDYQVRLVGRMLKSGGGILEGATGLGKTVCSAAMIRAFSRKDLISRGTPTCVFACPDRDINRKNWEELQKWLPDREVGLIMSGQAKIPSDDVVCCTIDSLEHIDPDEVGVMIVDEMHTSASATRSEKIAEFKLARRWGVSATPTGRFDGADIVAEGLYGPIVAEFTYQDGVKSGALVPITVLWMDAPEPVCGLTTYAKFKQREAKLRHGSLANEDFAQLVADILNCTPDDTQTLCIMQFIEQMSLIHRKCVKTGYVHAETNADKLVRYPDLQAIKPKERKEIYDKFRDGELTSMCATHVWSTGVDFRNLSVVINAGGGGSDIVAKQVPGRASRKADGKDRAYIVDFWHKWDREDPVTESGKPGPLLSNDFSRRRAYKELGFEQVQCPTITQIPFIDRNLAANTTSAKTMGRNLLL